MYSTSQIVLREEHSFCLFENISKLPISTNSSNDIISQIAQTQHFHESQIPKDQTDASVVINVFFKKYIYLTVFPNYFHQSNQFYQNNCTIYIVIFYGDFFEMFVFTCWFCFCFLFSLSFLFPAKVLCLVVKI